MSVVAYFSVQVEELFLLDKLEPTFAFMFDDHSILFA